jgi:hypothetical protein
MAFIFAFLWAFLCVDGWKVLQFYKRDNGRFVPVGSMCPDGGQMQKDNTVAIAAGLTRWARA